LAAITWDPEDDNLTDGWNAAGKPRLLCAATASDLGQSGGISISTITVAVSDGKGKPLQRA
jgi:hypothetical protein